MKWRKPSRLRSSTSKHAKTGSPEIRSIGFGIGAGVDLDSAGNLDEEPSLDVDLKRDLHPEFDFQRRRDVHAELDFNRRRDLHPELDFDRKRDLKAELDLGRRRLKKKASKAS